MAKKNDNDTEGFSKELLDQLLAGRDPKTVLESGGLIGELKKALAERMLNAEMDVHRAREAEAGVANHRNGSSPKTVLTPDGALELSIPRDRHGRFDPTLIAKYRRRFPGFDDKIVALYARGMSTRDIQAHVRELYGIEIPPDLVSAVTDAVIEEVTAWQARPLESSYAIVFFDALRVKIRDEGLVKNKAVYLAIGMRFSGHKEVLGLWIEQSEGAKFWLRVMNEIRGRGTQDILIAVVDGLKGFPDAITAVFPDTVVQTCIVHLIRYSMQFTSWKERDVVAATGGQQSFAYHPVPMVCHSFAFRPAERQYAASSSSRLRLPECCRYSRSRSVSFSLATFSIRLSSFAATRCRNKGPSLSSSGEIRGRWSAYDYAALKAKGTFEHV